MKELRAKANKLEASVHIGKEGLTDNVVKDIVRQVKKRKMVKVKMLKSSKCNAKEVANKTGLKIVQAVGGVVVLHGI